jgi:hypothetical protein
MRRNSYCSLNAPFAFLGPLNFVVVGFPLIASNRQSASGSNFVARMASRHLI